MTRPPCSGCGLRSCDGECFHESDEDSVALWNSILRLSGKHENMFGTVCEGDPMIKKDAA